MGLRLAVRIFTVLIGCLAITWGAITFPIVRRGAAIEGLAASIIRGDKFGPQQLLDQVPLLDTIENEARCEARGLRSDVVIRIRIVENAMNDADLSHLDNDMGSLRTAIGKTLSCSPTDAYVWLSLFWLNSLDKGLGPGDLDMLGMSYREGPNEGWIMVTRNHLALNVFSALPANLANRALTEFVELLQPEFVSAAVDNFIGPGWPIRGLLLQRIRDVPLSQRRTFAQILASKGYDQVDVPGVARADQFGR